MRRVEPESKLKTEIEVDGAIRETVPLMSLSSQGLRLALSKEIEQENLNRRQPKQRREFYWTHGGAYRGALSLLNYYFLAASLIMAAPLDQIQGAEPVTHWSPAELWRGVEVEQLPLDIQVIKSWEAEGCSYEKLTYVSEIADGTGIRIFAIRGAPKGAERMPGILHIHGGGQTASLAWVQYWAKRGYACVTYDFCGKWENRTEYTDWGPLAKNCNMASSGVYEMHPTPRISVWFHWALAGRRALTLLALSPSVDPEHLGIFGISVGGTLCWLVAGADARVKAAAPIYGCGYNVDSRKAIYGIVPSDDQLVYQQALSPEAHAPYIHCPVFFLSASNDHHGWIDDSFDTLGAVPAATRQVFTPHYIHHIEPEQGADLQPWMDWHLKGGRQFPDTPGLRLDLDEGGLLRATVQPQNTNTVKKVVIYYALGTKIPPSRFWRRVDPTQQASESWTGLLPVVSIWDRVAVFANVSYASGICLSTKLARVMPGQLGKARATLARTLEVDSCNAGAETWFFGPAYTDPNIDRTLLSSGEDEGRPYISVNKAQFGQNINFTICSHIFGDPQFQGPPGVSLVFDCKGGFDTNGLTITFAEGEWMPRGVSYKASVAQTEVSGGWKTVTVPLAKFTSEAGTTPASWARADRLSISGVATQAEPPRFSHFRWIPPS
jgi:dienelactone hydrolase